MSKKSAGQITGEFIIAKNTHGNIGTVELTCDLEQGKFYEGKNKRLSYNESIQNHSQKDQAFQWAGADTGDVGGGLDQLVQSVQQWGDGGRGGVYAPLWLRLQEVLLLQGGFRLRDVGLV